MAALQTKRSKQALLEYRRRLRDWRPGKPLVKVGPICERHGIARSTLYRAIERQA